MMKYLQKDSKQRQIHHCFVGWILCYRFKVGKQQDANKSFNLCTLPVINNNIERDVTFMK